MKRYFAMPSVSAFTWLALNFFAYFCAFGVLQPFFPLWLQHHGYSETMIALLMSSAYFLRFGGGLILSSRLHHTQDVLTRIQWVTLGTILTVMAVAYAADNAWLLVPMVWLFYTLNGGVMPLNETAASAWQRQIGLDYGKARLCGSAAYIVGALLAGWAATQLGANSLIYLVLFFLIMQWAVQFFKPIPSLEQKPKSYSTENTENTENQVKQNYLTLFKQPEIQKMLLAVSFLHGSHAAYYTYGVIYWKNQGLSEQSISWLWGISVLAEIVLFFFSQKWFKNQPIILLMKCSAILVVIRWLSLAWVHEPILLILVQILHAGTFGLSHYAMVKFISQQAPEQMAKLQALYIGLASCVSVAILTLLSGGLVKIAFEWAFIAMAFMGVLAWWILNKPIHHQ